MSVADLTGQLKEAFKEAQQDGKLYLTEEWDAWRKKREVENHSGGGAGKGRGRDLSHGCGGSSSGRSLKKPNDNECRLCDKMGYWACECRSKPKKE
jgi:hypothetical protein